MHEEQTPPLCGGGLHHRLARVHRRANPRNLTTILNLEAIVRAGVVANRGVVEEFLHVANECAELGHSGASEANRVESSNSSLAGSPAFR
jgi:hypothetical protein